MHLKIQIKKNKNLNSPSLGGGWGEVFKKFLSFNLLLLTLFSFSQSVGSVINKNLEVSGGVKQWEDLYTLYIQGEAVFGINNTYPVEIYQRKPNYTKTIFTIENKKQTVKGFDGKKGYYFNFKTNTLEDEIGGIIEPFESDLLNYKKKGFVGKYIGKQKVENTLCEVISLSRNGVSTTYYFDVKTYNLIKEENLEEITIYKKHKKVGDFLFPFQIESITKKDNQSFVLNISGILMNPILVKNFFKKK